MEPTLGEIRIFAFNFAPRGWATCDGQLLPIQQHQSLYAVLGTTYGGDGRTTFALPDLRGRTPRHVGPANQLGSKGGSETVALTVEQIPSHSHTLGVVAGAADTDDPAGALPATHESPAFATGSTSSEALATDAIPVSGGQGQGHENMQPFQVLNICIALQGIFPSRN